MEDVHLKRMVFKITSKCSLRCKLCLAYIPYYDKHEDVSYEDSIQILERFFSIVDYVDSFTLTGGEPLMNKSIDKIIDLLFQKYAHQFGKLVIVTNGTIRLSEMLLDSLKDKGRILLVVSNYGLHLSKKLNEVVEQCINNGIDYRVEDYCNEGNYKNGGWLDYRDHKLKHVTEEEILEQANACFFRQGKYYEINSGQIHLCSRSFYRMMSGIIPYNEAQYIDLLNPTQSIEADKKKMIAMDHLRYLDSCAYCPGNREDSPRYKPAEQI